MPLDPDRTLEIPLRELVDLLVEAWRMDRWLSGFETSNSTAAARYATRRMLEMLRAHDLSVLDLTGQPYEPGMAVELLENKLDSTMEPGPSVIDEMVSPVCLWRDVVVRQGQVVTKSPSAFIGGNA